MSSRPPPHLETVVARYLEDEENGKQPDRERIVREHPHLAEQLQTFFQEHDRWRRAFQLARTLESPDGDLPQAATAETASCEGQRFGDYQLLQEVDRGGMGIVFRARQISLGRIVALKMLRSGVLADGQEVSRFLHEARAAAALDHPGIVPVYEVGAYHGLHFFSMAYIAGQTLAGLIDQRPLPADDAARLTIHLARAVAYAHRQGVIHRDIKPSNVLIDQQQRPHLTDFGLAKTRWSGAPRTITGQILGTPAFMSPEQALGDRHAVGPAADIYGLGATLYAMLTGNAPHQAETAFGLLLQLRAGEPTAPRARNPQIPRELERVCLKCMEKRPADRYSSADLVADDLQRYLRGEPILAMPPRWDTRLLRFTRRFPVLVAHWILIGIACAILVFNAWFFPQQPRFYLRLGGVLLVWIAVCGILEWMRQYSALTAVARAMWAMVDVLLLSIAIAMAHPPRGPLMIGYGLLVVASGLFFRVRFVAFVTVINMVAFGALTQWLRDEPLRPANAVLFLLVLGGLGLITGGIVRHILALSRFYEETSRT